MEPSTAYLRIFCCSSRRDEGSAIVTCKRPPPSHAPECQHLQALPVGSSSGMTFRQRRVLRSCLTALLLGLLGSVPLLAADTTPSCCAGAPMTVHVTHAERHAGRTDAAQTITVTTTDYQFTMQSITISPGDTVTWTNNSGTTHTSTSNSGVWDSGDIVTGSSFSQVFTTTGTFPYHCKYHVNLGMTGTIIVAAPPVITSALTASGSVGVPFSYTIVASGATSFSATGLPAGLSIASATGAITGTPTAAAASVLVNLVATGPGGNGTAMLTVAITQPAPGSPTITSPAQATGAVGTGFLYTILASNTPTSFTASALPAGLSLNSSTGAISGTPTAAGTTDVVIGAANGSGSAQTTMSVTIAAAAPGTTTTGTTGTTGTTYTPVGSSSGSGCGLGAGGLGLLGLMVWWRSRRPRQDVQ
jgi:plastocyanin